MNPTIEISFKTAQAYSAMCKPLCQELKLPQTAFDILMFLANNPDCTTARDIVEIRKIKANLVSVNVDRLVQEGYLERRAVAGDRRKTQLLCTEKAQPVIARGREVQERFFARLLQNTDAATREAFFRTMEVIGKNLDEGSTMIVVTHEMEFAKNVSDKIIFMADGVVEEMGTPQQIYENPQSEKTKAFLANSLEKF